MSRALNHLLLPPRLLGRACLVTAMLTTIQAVTLFGITNLMGSIFDPTAPGHSVALAGVGKVLLTVMGLSGVYAGWLLMAQAGPSGSGLRNFLNQIPVSPLQRHRARVRTNLTSFFLPTLLSLGILMVAASTRGITLEVGAFALDLLAGLLLGIAVLSLTQLTSSSPLLKKVAVLAAAFLPAVVLLALSSLVMTAIAAALALGLLFLSWRIQPQAYFAAPTQLIAQQQSTAAKAIGSGRWILTKWILRHTVFQWRILLISIFVLVYPAEGLGEIDYSRHSQDGMLFFFLGIVTFTAAMVSKKLEFLPISKRRMFAYIVLPMFTLLTLSVTAVEIANAHGVFAETEKDRGKLPIRYEFASSLHEEGSALRLLVPPQLLEFTSSGTTQTVQGPKGESYEAPVMPLIWPNGPGYFNPFEVPEAKLKTSPDAAKLAYQLERALTAFYGSSLPATELRARFISERKGGNVYFQRTEFEEWQTQWATEHQGAFVSQDEYWQQQLVHLMPARAIGWVVGWGMVLWVVFTIRARFVSRRRRAIQQGVMYSILAGFLAYTVEVRTLLAGVAFTDGFAERSRMMSSEAVRALLPDNLALAWIAVAVVFCAVYSFAYRAYCNAEWSSNQVLTGLAKSQNEKWAKI